MLEENEIKAHLEAADRHFVTDVRIRSYDEAILLYIPREKVAPKVKKGMTSIRQIKNLEKHLSVYFSTIVQVIFVMSESQSDLEAGFYQLINRRFDDQIKSLYISFSDESTIDAWIEVEGLDSCRKADVRDYFSKILKGTNLALRDVQWIGAKINLPTAPAILKLIKTLQPVSLDIVLTAFKENYDAVDEKWLKKTLDNLRKKGMLHWQQPGTYTLTASSLAFVPAGARRSSSDVDRALALGRRKWSN